MTWLIILNLAVLCVSVVFYVRALFRYYEVKEYFWSILPGSEKECITSFPRYPLWYYKMRSTPWNDRIAEDLVKRNQILMEYDREKAAQLILAEKQMYWAWIPIGLATVIFLYLFWVKK